jgi:phospholipid/cholesterol/gamma-HCH transport system permease protein
MKSNDTLMPPSLDWDEASRILACSGDWTLAALSLRSPSAPRSLQGRFELDTTGVRHLDTAGAVCIRRQLTALQQQGGILAGDRILPPHQALLDLVTQHQLPIPAAPLSRFGLLSLIGEWSVAAIGRFMAFFTFVGAVASDSLPRFLRPHSIRWRQVVAEIDHGGVRALPILALLLFLTGVVIAYQGGAPLQQYGANIYLVDLLTLTMLREMAPLMTAIIVAGRTGSAYTAQIGTMHITEEVDALRVIGISPYEMLVLPKLIAMLIAMPLLTTFASFFGMLGGIVVAATWFDVGLWAFIQRIPEAVVPSSFWVGMIKAPVFAVLIVSVACYQGFQVRGSTESVGRATTRSVVHGIFLVIVADAIFSVIFNEIGL